MEFLAFLYTVLLVAICLMMALLLYRSAKPMASRDDTELKEWLRQQLAAQNRQMEAKLAEMSQQNLAAMGQISETLQASVQSMSTVMGDTPHAVHQSMISSLSGLVHPFSQLCTVRSPFSMRLAISAWLRPADTRAFASAFPIWLAVK